MLQIALSPLSLARKQVLLLTVPLACSVPLLASHSPDTPALWLALAGWLLALALLRVITAAVRQDMADMQQALAALADGQLQTRVRLGRRDELGVTGEWINALGRRMSGLLGGVAKAASELGYAAHEVNQASASMRVAMERQRDLAMSSSATLEQLSSSLAVTADNMQQTARAADLSHAAAQQGWQAVGAVASHLQGLSAQMEQALERVSALEERSRAIERIVRLIDEIADRTGLLALNAAIEAARAGEAGRGFAVVADEVRKLAEQTQRANADIGQSLAAVMGDVHDSASLMRNGAAGAHSGARQAGEAAALLARIRDETAQACLLAQQMAHAIAEQSTASQALARNVEAGAQLAEANTHHVAESADVAAYLDRLSSELHTSVSTRREVAA